MKKSVLFVCFALTLIVVGCTATKESNLPSDQELAQSEELKEKSAKLEKLEAELTASKASLRAIESQLSSIQIENDDLASQLEVYEGSIGNVKSNFLKLQDQLKKIKSEIAMAFPNNLNDPNFQVIEEDGRLIISLPNKILYQSGQADFNEPALEVIGKLSQVFRNNKGMQIVVEGHTDNIPLKKGSQYKDNWDLSMARAVKVVRQLETYGVFPARLTAAGRGYFAPKSTLDTEEARALNRRTEIIIRPSIADLLKTMDVIM